MTNWAFMQGGAMGNVFSSRSRASLISKCITWRIQPTLCSPFRFMHSSVQLLHNLQLLNVFFKIFPRGSWRARPSRPWPIQPTNESHNSVSSMAKRRPVVPDWSRSCPWANLRPKLFLHISKILQWLVLRWWALLAIFCYCEALEEVFKQDFDLD